MTFPVQTFETSWTVKKPKHIKLVEIYEMQTRKVEFFFTNLFLNLTIAENSPYKSDGESFFFCILQVEI